MGRGVKSTWGINNPGVEELPRGDKTSGVTPKGDRVRGADRRGRGGDRNSPATQDTEASGDSSSSKEMASGLGLVAPTSPQRGTVLGIGSKVSTHRHPNVADGARPEHGALACRKYTLLAPEEPSGDPAATEPQESGDSPEATMETGGIDVWATKTGDLNAQSALLA